MLKSHDFQNHSLSAGSSLEEISAREIRLPSGLFVVGFFHNEFFFVCVLEGGLNRLILKTSKRAHCPTVVGFCCHELYQNGGGVLSILK